MKLFKFFQKNKSIQEGNYFLGFNMDDILINVLRYKQYHNQDILLGDTPIASLNVPINNCWLRVLNWRNNSPFDVTNNPTIEIDYRIFETNNMPIDFTFRMETGEFLRRMELQ